ncbi:MBL fold metallo-hydrolase [Elioraea sp.]|uniref:MBL fold metallo-hydrolase n=1 Tax=Elioraea sp. TaxID=2185103 RepID=UPI0025C20682|nr:MBL fold metallo-hydrolase [Elioraea sp.]
MGATFMRLTLLGTGCPQVDPLRMGPANLVQAAGRALLFDCGSGVTQRLVQAGTRGAEVDALFLTHLHSDHVVDFHQLIVSSWHQGREKPWKIFGPPGTIGFVERSAALWKPELDFRIAHEKRPNEAGLDVQVTEYADGQAFRGGGVTVTAVKVNHDPFPETYGFVIEQDQLRVVLSSDTTVWPPLIAAARGADLLLHEVFIRREMRPDAAHRPQETIDAVAAYHTLSTEVGRVAAEADVAMLVLNHFVPTRFDAPALVAEVRAHWPGPLVLGEDLMSFDIAARTLTHAGATIAFAR